MQPQVETMVEQQPCALRDFALSDTRGLQTNITRPPVNTNIFEIKPILNLNGQTRPIWW